MGQHEGVDVLCLSLTIAPDEVSFLTHIDSAPVCLQADEWAPKSMRCIVGDAMKQPLPKGLSAVSGGIF